MIPRIRNKIKEFFKKIRVFLFFLVFCNVLTTSIFDFSASAKTDDDAFVSSESSTCANCCNETSEHILLRRPKKGILHPMKILLFSIRFQLKRALLISAVFMQSKMNMVLLPALFPRMMQENGILTTPLRRILCLWKNFEEGKKLRPTGDLR